MSEQERDQDAWSEELLDCEPFLGRDTRSLPKTVWGRMFRHWGFYMVPIVLTLFFFAIGDLTSVNALLWGFVGITIISTCFGSSMWAIYGLVTGKAILRSKSQFKRYVLHAATLIGSVVIGAEAAYLALRYIPGLPDMDISRPDLYRVGGLVMTVLFAIDFTYARLRSHARAVELRGERARRNAVRAQLEALQARTDPHFLFNSLNTVASLIEEDPRLAERAVERLSGLFRYALEGSRRTEVRLAEEMEAVRGYLEVESLRLGDRLRTEIRADDGCDEYLVPPLLLQPLVENAVLHGVTSRVEGGRVEVTASCEDGALRLRVCDDGPGPGSSPHAGSGTALETLRSRLDLLFGDAASLSSRVEPNVGYTVEIALPLAQLRPAKSDADEEGAA